MSKSAQDIIYDYCQGRLNPNPDYYEGHGNSLYDLNSQILEMVYGGILAERGPEAAKSFVNMVKNLTDTNASSFLKELYRMERKNWRWSEPVLKVRAVSASGEAGAEKTEGGQSGGASGLTSAGPVIRTVGEILNAFRRGASRIGHDKDVTGDFLEAHKAEIESSLFKSSFGN